MDSKLTGSTGENIACGYLENNKYIIVCRNYRTAFGEIDIVAKSPDKTLVFIEVKTTTISNPLYEFSSNSCPQPSGNTGDKLGNSCRTTQNDGLNTYPSSLYSYQHQFSPEDHLDPGKIYRFRRMAEWYTNKFSNYFTQAGYRLDAITIELDGDRFRLRHYENIC